MPQYVRSAYTPPTPEVLRWVTRQVHPRARLLAVAPLRGGITADMDRITVESDRQLEVVLRRWRADEADPSGLVLRESKGLAVVAEVDVPTPYLLAADQDGTAAGVPCTLTSFVAGRPQLRPGDLPSWLDQLARAQARVHRAPGKLSATWHGFFADRYRALDWVQDRGLREAARAAAGGGVEAERVVVHGDYQPFNVLWQGDQLSGIVDWPNAAMGNRGHDVGHCRLNIAVLFGPDAAAHYLQAYERAAGLRVDRRADLQGLLAFTTDWPRFIPIQVAGRADVDVDGMADRVTAAVRHAVDGID